MPRPLNVKLLHGDVYAVGAFTGISSSQIPNGQQLSYNGLIKFPNGTMRNPQPVGGGVSFPSGKGMCDITSAGGTDWMVGQGNGSEQLFAYDANSETWVPQSVTADSFITFVEAIDDTTLLLLGKMNHVNNVLVNKGCTYNTQTGAVTPLSPTGLGQYGFPLHTFRSSDGIIYIGTWEGACTYNTNTKVFQVVPVPVPYTASFAGHGDTMYVVGLTNIGANGGGDGVWQKIGSGNWTLVCYAPIATVVSIHFIDDKLHIMGPSKLTTMPDSTVYTGSDLAYYETSGSIDASGMATIHGMLDYLELPDGEYLGWSNGALFTSQSLVSGVTTLHDQTAITLYPNPATTYTVISGVEYGTEILMMNALGQTIWKATATSETIRFDTQGLAPGLYFVNKHKLIVR